MQCSSQPLSHNFIQIILKLSDKMGILTLYFMSLLRTLNKRLESSLKLLLSTYLLCCTNGEIIHHHVFISYRRYLLLKENVNEEIMKSNQVYYNCNTDCTVMWTSATCIIVGWLNRNCFALISDGLNFNFLW